MGGGFGWSERVGWGEGGRGGLGAICLQLLIINSQMNFSQQIMTLQVYAGTDMVKKCKKYDEFWEEMSQIEVQYSHDLNMAIYASLDDVQSMGVFQLAHKPILTISFFAYLMPPYQSYASKFYLLWIKLLDQNLRLNIGKRYCIVYYHTLSDSNYPYHFLVGIFKKLPVYYYAMLDRIYVVGAPFFLRKSAGLFDFGRLYKLFQRKLEIVEKLSEFAEIVESNRLTIFDALPERMGNELQIKTQKRMLKQQKNKPKVDPPIPAKVYVPVPKKLDCLMVQLKSHKLDKQGMPVPLGILIKTLRAHPQFLELEGIFRKSGSIEEEEEIIEELVVLGQGESLKKLADYSGYAVAGVVKKFFTKLLTPIVPYALYSKLLSILSETQVKAEEQVSFILDFLHELPVLNKKIVLHLMAFLKGEVIAKQEKNKMNNYNMSVCFCPCIFRSETPTLADLLNSGKFAGILNIYFSRFEEVMAMQERSSSGSEGEKTSRPASSFKHFRLSMA